MTVSLFSCVTFILHLAEKFVDYTLILRRIFHRLQNTKSFIGIICYNLIPSVILCIIQNSRIPLARLRGIRPLHCKGTVLIIRSSFLSLSIILRLAFGVNLRSDVLRPGFIESLFKELLRLFKFFDDRLFFGRFHLQYLDEVFDTVIQLSRQASFCSRQALNRLLVPKQNLALLRDDFAHQKALIICEIPLRQSGRKVVNVGLRNAVIFPQNRLNRGARVRFVENKRSKIRPLFRPFREAFNFVDNFLLPHIGFKRVLPQDDRFPVEI